MAPTTTTESLPVTDRAANSLPSFAQSFPPSDTEASPTTITSHDHDQKHLPSILNIPRPQLTRNAVSDSGHSHYTNGKRGRDDLLNNIKDDPDDSNPDDALESPTPPDSSQLIQQQQQSQQQQQQSPPKKKRRTSPSSVAPQPPSSNTTPSSAETVGKPTKAKRSPNISKRSAAASAAPNTGQTPPSAQPPPSSTTPTRADTKGNHTLPSSTKSFTTRRRAMNRDFGLSTSPSSFSARKGAPSDLVISPPPTGVANQHLQPLIQSAPPVPASRLRLHSALPATREPFVSISRTMHRGGGGNSAGSTATATGRAPPKTAGLVSSTPIPMTGMATAGGTAAPPLTTGGGRGFRTNIFPPTPTGTGMATAGSAMSTGGMYHPHPPVPPTPSSLRHALNQPRPPPPQPHHSNSLPTVPIAASASVSANPHSSAANPGAKQAFLAPFGEFYDSLLDAHQLKTWLSDQLTRSNALLSGLGSVEEEIERRVRPMREEVDWLRGRVGELEELVLHMRAASGIDGGAAAKGKGKGGSSKLANGGGTGSGSGSTLSIATPMASRRSHSPQNHHSHPHPSSPTPSPEPDSTPNRRVNTSSSRLDPHPQGRMRVPSPLASGTGSRNGSSIDGKDKEKDKEVNSGGEEEKKGEKMETD